MKVRISYTVEVPDDFRRQINEHYGRPGLADRREVQAWYRAHGESMDDNLAAGWVGDNPDDEEEEDDLSIAAWTCHCPALPAGHRVQDHEEDE